MENTSPRDTVELQPGVPVKRVWSALQQLGLKWPLKSPFWGHQGFLTPGVRLLRQVTFGVKSTWLALAFLIPLVVLLWGFHRISSDLQHRSALELQGVAYVRPVVAHIQSLLDERKLGYAIYQGEREALTQYDASRQAIAKTMADLSTIGARWDSRFGTASERLLLQQKVDLLMQAPVPVAGDLAQYRAASQARKNALDQALHFLLTIADASELTLDPQLDTYCLMDASILATVPLSREWMDIRIKAARILREPTQAAALRVELAGVMAVVEERLEQIDRDLTKIEHAGVQAPTDLMKINAAWHQDFLTQSYAYLSWVKRMAFEETQTPQASSVQDLLTQGDVLMAKMAELQAQTLNALELGLTRRLNKLSGFYRVVMGLVAVGMLVALYMLLSFHHVMDGGLEHLRTQVVRMASGDLSARPKPWGNDEVAHALNALANSIARLADLLAEVRKGVAAISHASDEVSSGNQDLADRTATTTQSIDQVLNALAAFQSQLGRNANMVDQVVEHSRGMMVHAVRSRDAMGLLRERMKSLNSKSREIGEIIGLIEGIAFQTHILALNASVEASRAGESGKGFAVVAQEVRDLARRSANSAKLIGDLISNSITDIENGSELAEHAGEAVRSTVQTVDEVNVLMKSLSAVTRDGRQSARDMSDAIESVSDATRGNIDLVNGLSQATVALRDQGQRLASQVEGFKLS